MEKGTYCFYTVTVWESESHYGLKQAKPFVSHRAQGLWHVAPSSPANPEVTRSNLQASVYTTCSQQTPTTILDLTKQPTEAPVRAEPRSSKSGLKQSGLVKVSRI